MLDDGAIGRGDPSVRHHFRDSVSDTMRITDLAAPRKIPREPVGGNSSIPFHFTKLIQVNRPGNGTTAIYRDVSVGISVGNMSSRLCPARAAWGSPRWPRIGGVFRECRPENVIAIDAVPSFGTLADRIDESPPGITPPLSTTPMSRATQTFANTWGKTRSGSTYWPEIGHQTSPGRSSRRCSPQCCLGCGELIPSLSSTPRPT